MSKPVDWCWGKAGFFARLIQVIPRTDWPDFQDRKMFWDNWCDEFERCGVAEQEANQAVGQLASQRIGFVVDYLPAIIEKVALIHEQTTRNNPGQESFIRAKEASSGCPECGGEGWASREFRKPSHVDAVLMGAMLCRCDAGRAVKRAIEAVADSDKDGSDLYRVADDLQAHPKLWGVGHARFPKMPLPGPIVHDDSYWLTVEGGAC